MRLFLWQIFIYCLKQKLMKLFLVLSLALLALFDNPKKSNFKESQLKFSRVSKAHSKKQNYIKQSLKEKNINSEYDLFLRAFKKEAFIEVWVKNKKDQKFINLKNYTICSSSGKLGPKRKMGDLQVPEGFYFIDRFNPSSNFHLSLGINYPNNSDRILSTHKNLGGDIFIHGNCVTVGCLPLTNEFIEEVYLLALEAKSTGQNHIPVHIFPTKLDSNNYQNLRKEYSSNTLLLDFWANLKEGYEYFEANKSICTVSVDKKGKYVFQKPSIQ